MYPENQNNAALLDPSAPAQAEAVADAAPAYQAPAEAVAKAALAKSQANADQAQIVGGTEEQVSGPPQMTKRTNTTLNMDLINPLAQVSGWMTLAITSVNMNYDKSFVEKIDPHVKIITEGDDYRLSVGGDATIADPNAKLAEQFSDPLAERSIIKLAICNQKNEDKIDVWVMDNNIFENEFVALAKISLAELTLKQSGTAHLFYNELYAGEIEWNGKFTAAEHDEIEAEKKKIHEQIAQAKAEAEERERNRVRLEAEAREREEKRIRDANSGWLTLTIKSAQLTHDTELIGKMDPYVAFNFNGKDFKTTVQKKAGKNPKWDETFNIPVYDKRVNDKVTFVFWDKELIKDDYIGDAGIYLSRLIKPGEGSFPIQYKKDVAGTMSFSTHFKQAGWDALKDGLIEFENAESEAELAKGGKSGFIQLSVNRAKLTHNTQMIGHMDPYVKWTYNKKDWRTSTDEDGGKEPVWNETFKLPCEDFTKDVLIKFAVWDENTLKDSLIGDMEVQVRDLVRKRNKEKYPISFKGKDAGFIVLHPAWEAADAKAIAAEQKGGGKDDVPMDLGTNVDGMSAAQIGKLTTGLKGTCGWINLTIRRAALTHDTEALGKMDPYVTWKHGEKTYKTTVQKNAGKNPVWGEKFKLPVLDRTVSTNMRFSVMDEETFKDDTIGMADIELGQLLVPGDCCIPLCFKKDQPAGTLAWTSEWEEDTKENIQNVWGASSTPKGNPTPKAEGGFFRKLTHHEEAPKPVEVAAEDAAGVLTLTIKKAEVTHDTETFGKMDPYTMWEYEGQTYKTTVKDNIGKKPVWNEVFNMTIAKKDLGHNEVIHFSVMDHEKVTHDKLIADADQKIDELLINGDKDINLMWKGKIAGTLHIGMKWAPH